MCAKALSRVSRMILLCVLFLYIFIPFGFYYIE